MPLLVHYKVSEVFLQEFCLFFVVSVSPWVENPLGKSIILNYHSTISLVFFTPITWVFSSCIFSFRVVPPKHLSHTAKHDGLQYYSIVNETKYTDVFLYCILQGLGSSLLYGMQPILSIVQHKTTRHAHSGNKKRAMKLALYV